MKMNQNDWPGRENCILKEGEKKALCRCWQSKKFPFCDGSHREWNEKNSDDIGPIIVESLSKD